MEQDNEQITDLGLLSNKQLKELTEQCELAYSAAQKIANEQYDIMERAASVYADAKAILERRQGKGRKKKETDKK